MSARALLALLLLLCAAAAARGDAPTNVTQIIEGFGYPCEQHYVATEDGWVLSVQRIPRPGAPAVFLQHGVLDSANTWVMNFPSESLAFILHDAGFDVWLGNSRGNGYSMINNQYTPDQLQFWAFSWDQMAIFDLPACFAYIVAQTGRASLSYVGHSQGTTIALAHQSMQDMTAGLVDNMILLAPVMQVNDVSSLMLKLFADLHVEALFELLGDKAFLPTSSVLQHLLPDVCKLFEFVCEYPACALVGCDKLDVNASRFDFYFSHFPSPTSVQNMAHWSQGVRDNAFLMYDYGSAAGNQIHYGRPTPPAYNVSEIKTPIAVFYGGVDVLADPTNVRQILDSVPSVYTSQELPSYGHLDFVWGQHANTELYARVVQLLRSTPPALRRNTAQ